MKVVSIMRVWLNGAVISIDNLETSCTSECFFLVRLFLIFKSSKHYYKLLGFQVPSQLSLQETCQLSVRLGVYDESSVFKIPPRCDCQN